MFIRMLGINVLLSDGLVINERTLKYFVVCLILAWTLHTWKFNLFLITWYSFFQHSPYADSAGTSGLLSENQLLASASLGVGYSLLL